MRVPCMLCHLRYGFGQIGFQVSQLEVDLDSRHR